MKKNVESHCRELGWRLPAVRLSMLPGLEKAMFALCRLRAKAEKYIAVNALTQGGNEARFSVLRHRENKSDAFMLTERTERGMQVYLIDGGLSTGESLKELMDLRKRILISAGLENQISNGRYKLEITLLISHFHIDHMNELIHFVLPCRKYIRVKAAYYPSASQFAKDQNHKRLFNGDVSHRPNMMRAAACYQPLMEKHEMAFGQTCTLPLAAGEIKLFMPHDDWGAPEAAAFFSQAYHGGDKQKIWQNLSVSVVNANSLWMRISAAGKAVLLTGDTTKKFEDAEEALDRMIADYGEELRSDVVKWPHHGVGRNAAFRLVTEKLFRPGDENACILLTALEGEKQAGRLLQEAKIPYACSSEGEIAFVLNKEGLRRVGKEKVHD